ncbi:molybdenum cofactor guanylyltransferase [Microlunatus speluncae]|uniref:molybdenum cofactor guanylyltransferase n=1 Tax=Microlunatus speluncae TaxID=2594267 RepID=UPI001375A5EC|nr:NTP transferase domain-containing protein [Microlunatus speluncae]
MAVVLAGGASRRYGADKLAADVVGAPLLDRAVAGLAGDRRVIIVGPARTIGRPVEFVADDHPGGGPAAAMITGLRAALATPAELITVHPGDAPGGGTAAETLLARLAELPDEAGVIAVDQSGQEQPLQFAIRRPAAERLIEAAGAEGGANASARRLVLPLGLTQVELAAAETWDIDTPDQHRAWAWRDSPAVRQILAAIDAEAPAKLILLGAEPAAVTALVRAVVLARRGFVAGPSKSAASAGWTTAVLLTDDPASARTSALRIALRSVGDPLGPDGVDLWVNVP